jgi:hypothetical protein
MPELMTRHFYVGTILLLQAKLAKNRRHDTPHPAIVASLCLLMILVARGPSSAQEVGHMLMAHSIHEKRLRTAGTVKEVSVNDKETIRQHLLVVPIRIDSPEVPLSLLKILLNIGYSAKIFGPLVSLSISLQDRNACASNPGRRTACRKIQQFLYFLSGE